MAKKGKKTTIYRSASEGQTTGIKRPRRSALPLAEQRIPDAPEGAISIHPASAQAENILQKALAEDRGTGISAAVVIDRELVFSRAVGSADRHRRLGTNARMRTASVAKILTAVAAARLVDMRKLNLNDPIATLVPEIPNGEITPYQLGTHLAGIRHYNFRRLAEANNRKRYRSLTDALAMFSSDPLLSKPGTAFHYSSFGYNLLGVVIERAYGATYGATLHDLIATPLELPSLGIDDVEAEIPFRPAFNTMVFGRIRVNAPRRENSDLYPSGGLVVSAPDLAVFVDAVFNSDFLQPETVQLIKRAVSTPEGLPTGYSFGWQIGQSDDSAIEWYGHGGQTNGAYASARYYPASGMTVVGLTNYNFWLTAKRPKYFEAIRTDRPALFKNG